MSMKFPLNRTAVIGAGLMGGQIGLVLALGSRETVLMSRKRETLERTLENINRYAADLQRHGNLGDASPPEVLKRIRMTIDLEEAVGGADFVVESIVEDLGQKQALFHRMDEITPPGVPLVSNTSSLPITQLAAHAVHRERIAGSHFVQPGHIVPVVEVVSGEDTTEETLDRTAAVWEMLGRFPIRIKRDVPGFLINRLQHALIREAVNLLSSGVASVEDIDTAVRLGLAPRFTTAGPLEQRDINGLNMHVRVAGYLWKTLDGWKAPLEYLQEMVSKGHTGINAGKGYYDWSGKNPESVRRQKDEFLLRRTKQVMDDWNRENQ